MEARSGAPGRVGADPEGIVGLNKSASLLAEKQFFPPFPTNNENRTLHQSYVSGKALIGWIFFACF